MTRGRVTASVALSVLQRARVEGVWTCVQDHYASGFRPETACGETLPEFA